MISVRKLVPALTLAGLAAAGLGLAVSPADAGNHWTPAKLGPMHLSSKTVTPGGTLTVSADDCTPKPGKQLDDDAAYVSLLRFSMKGEADEVASDETAPTAHGSWSITLSIPAKGRHAVHPGDKLFLVGDCDVYEIDNNYPVVHVGVATDHSKLTIASLPDMVFGDSSILAGSLTDLTTKTPVAKALVTLQQNTGSRWVTVGKYPTSPKGVVTAAVSPDQQTDYRWYFPGSSTVDAAYSPVSSASVSDRIAFSVGKQRSHRSTVVVAYGTVAPADPGSRVLLQVKRHNHWAPLDATKLSKQTLPSGKKTVGYSFAETGLRDGAYTLRVVTVGDDEVDGSTSAPKTITVG